MAAAAAPPQRGRAQHGGGAAQGPPLSPQEAAGPLREMRQPGPPPPRRGGSFGPGEAPSEAAAGKGRAEGERRGGCERLWAGDAWSWSPLGGPALLTRVSLQGASSAC